MEETNHTFESSGPPTTGQYAGMGSLSWFDYDEFMDFADDRGQLDEISVQARRKMARTAKRTAKRRARVRKRKEKRRKPKSALKKKAQKAAINKVRAKLIKGMKWNDVPFMQREKIDAKVKKKRKRIAQIAKRMMPAMQKAEKARLAKVRSKMTSNDPKKAVESLDIDFENFLMEAEVQSKPEQSKPEQSKPEQPKPEQPEESKKQKKCSKCMSDSPVEVERGDGQIEIILFKQVKDGVHKLISSSPINSASQAKAISKKDGFVCGTTAQKLGVDCEAVKGKDSPEQSGDLDGDGDVDARDGEIAASDGTATIAKNKAATAKSNAELTAQQRADEEEEENIQALADQQKYANNANAVSVVYTYDQVNNPNGGYQLPTTANGMREDVPIVKMSSKGTATRGMQFDASAHSATDIESAVVFAKNGCGELLTPEEIAACAGKANISNTDFNKIIASPTLIGAGQRVVDRMNLSLGEEWEAFHSGKGFGETKLSSMWDSRGAINKTPKADLIFKNRETGKLIRVSQKIGAGQLASGSAGESMATIDAVERRMIQSGGFLKDPTIIKEMGELKDLINEGERRYKLADGMGPTKWWLKNKDGEPNKISGSKPSWWNTSGPGKPCAEGKKPGQGCGVPWEQAKGKAALDNTQWFDGHNKEMTDKLDRIQAHNRVIEEKYASMMENNDEFKRQAIFETVTGCAKFCDCPEIECCIDTCDSTAMATHLLTAKKDGTEASLDRIGGIYGRVMDTLMERTDINASVKSGQVDTKASPKIGQQSGAPVVRFGTDSTSKDVGTGTLADKKRADAITRSDTQTESVQTFLEYGGDGSSKLQKALHDIGNDPFKMMRFLEMDIDLSITHEDLGGAFSDSGSAGKTEITIGRKKHFIPIMKPENEYRDYQKEYEEGIPNYDESKGVNESFRLLTEPDILDRLVGQLRSKGMDKDKAYAIATSSLQKNKVLKKGSHELTSKGKNRNSMTPGERAKSRAAKKDGGKPSNYNYNAKTNIATQIESSELNEALGSNERKLLSKGIHHASNGKAKVTPKNVHKFSSEIKAAGMHSISKANLGGKDKKSHKNLQKYFKNDVVHQRFRSGLNLGEELIHEKIKKKMIRVKLNPEKKIGWEMHGVGPGGKKTLLKKGESKPINYEFKDSSVHGMGSFATRDIEEGESVSLYLLSLLSEDENAPEYQRTDFCRFTNHSQHTPNLIMVENQDGNFFTYTSKDVKEGEEFIINYFSVAEHILPLLKEHGQIIPEVLRWTRGYEDIEFPPDNFKDFTDELNYFQEINEGAGDASAAGNPKRAAYLKTYNAQPEQRANRSKRTLARRELIKQGRVKVGDGKDVHHNNGNPSDNSPSNLSVKSVNNNRGLDNNKWRERKEEHGAGEVGTKELLKKYLKDTPYMTINGKFADEL